MPSLHCSQGGRSLEFQKSFPLDGWLIPTENMWLLLNMAHLFLLQISERIGLNLGCQTDGIASLSIEMTSLCPHLFHWDLYAPYLMGGQPLAIDVIESTGAHSLVKGRA